MTAAFDSGLDALRLELGDRAAERVLRTEIADDGTIVFTLVSDGEPACFRWSGGRLLRLDPERDAEIPFARTIALHRRAGTGRLLSWRPARRMVARIDEERGPCVVKAWRKGRAERAIRVHEGAREALRGAFVLAGVTPVSGGLDAARFEHCSGAELSFADHAACRLIGAGVATLQARMDAAALPRHGRAEELGVLRTLARRHASVRGRLPDGFERALGEIDALAGDAPDPVVAAHRDLHDGQFAIRERDIAVFDFDLASRAERELDLANLCAHAAWCGIQGVRGVDERTSERAEEALRAGFAGDLDERAFAFYRATTLLRLALVFGVRPRWERASGRLVDLARAACGASLRA